MFFKLSELLVVFGALFCVQTRLVEGAASECGLWSRVADSLMKEEIHNASCLMSTQCTGFHCAGLSESMDAVVLNRHVSFTVDIQPCSYPLTMNVRLDHWAGIHFDRSIDIHSTGAQDFTLPLGVEDLFLADTRVVRKLSVTWSFKPVPINGMVELEIIYTARTRTAQEPETEITIVLVPKFVVPVANCPVPDKGHQVTLPRTTPQPESRTTKLYPMMQHGVMPLIVGIGLTGGILVLVCAVLIQRHWMALRLNRRATNRHMKLVNEDGPEDWMPQV